MQAARPMATVQASKQAYVEELKTLPIALHTDKANEQHYEVRAAGCHAVSCLLRAACCCARSPRAQPTCSGCVRRRVRQSGTRA